MVQGRECAERATAKKVGEGRARALCCHPKGARPQVGDRRISPTVLRDEILQPSGPQNDKQRTAANVALPHPYFANSRFIMIKTVFAVSTRITPQMNSGRIAARIVGCV